MNENWFCFPKTTCWFFFLVKPWLLQQPQEAKLLISVCLLKGQKFSFHMSYSLLDLVEIWQIFITKRLELLKTHHCAVCTIGIQMRKSSKTVLRKNVWTLPKYMSWLKSAIFTFVISLRNSLFTYLRWTMTKLQLHCSTVIAGVGPKPNFSAGSPPIVWFLKFIKFIM